MKETDSKLEASFKPKVTLIYYSSLSSFIKNDGDILSRHFSLREVNLRSIRDIPELARAIGWCDLSFIWFAGKHAVPAVTLSKAFSKRSVIIAGGYDVAFEPEMNYGQFTLGWNEKANARFTLNNADAVLAVSKFTKGEALKRSSPKNLSVVYNGIDTARFRPGGKKENLVLTVAAKGSTKNMIRLKGVDTFIGAAASVPEARFEVVGLREEDLSGEVNIPENVDLLGRLDQEQLIDRYQRAKVCCQLSFVESFGVALAEAMACGCVPVATQRGAIPEIVGDTGFYVPFGDVKRSAEGIRIALKSDGLKPGLSEKARDRIKAYFTQEKREKELTRVIHALCHDL
jgi:glycosyltransferase involved in cell wall biosynthesis